MYEVKVNDKTLYYPSNNDYSIFDTELSQDVGLAGEFTFKVPNENLSYSQIGQGAIITILRDGSEYWRGEVKEIKTNIDKTLEVYCLEDLAWLADEFIFPTLMTNETYAQRFQAAIDAYNADRPSDRQFSVGNLTSVTSSAYCTWKTEYEWSILDSIRNCICRDTGYLKVRRSTVGGVVTRYIDCVKLSDYGSQATQTIQFGVNLLTYVKEMKLDNFTNALTPYGSETDTEVYSEYSQRLAGDPIENAASIAAYGRHAKAVVFETDDLTTLNNLATAYLTRYSQPQIRMEIGAVDLAEMTSGAHFELGDSIHIIAEPFAVDQWIYLTSRTMDIQDIGRNTVTLSSYVTRSSTITDQSVDTSEIVKALPSKANILDAAKRNAYEILTGELADGGTVTFVTNADDQITELRIANDLDFSNATQCWRWNLGGLAYMHRDNPTDAWTVSTAIGMDGGIVADFLTSGTINAIDINGSTISGSRMEWTDSNDANLGYVAWQNIIEGTDTLEFYSSSHVSMKCAANNMGTLYVKGGIDATRNISTNLKFYQNGMEVPTSYTSDLNFSVFESGGYKYLGVYTNGSIVGNVRLS